MECNGHYVLYCIKYVGGKEIKYVVSEHFPDTFSINIFVTFQIYKLPTFTHYFNIIQAAQNVSSVAN